MPKPSDKKLIQGIRKAVAKNGYVSVRMECGGDQTCVSFGNWETEELWTPEKSRLKNELVRKLNLPNASETSVDGHGEISIQGGELTLAYSITDVNYGHLSLEQEQLPIPDAKNVLISTPDDFPEVDFGTKLWVHEYRTPTEWQSEKCLKIAPVISEHERRKVVSFLEPIIAPLFRGMQIGRAECNVGDVRVTGIYFDGFCWHSKREMLYEIELVREVVREVSRNKSIVLFD